MSRPSRRPLRASSRSVSIKGSPSLALAGDLLVYWINRDRAVLAGLDAATRAVRWTKE